MTLEEQARELGVKVMTHQEVMDAGLKSYVDVYECMAGWKARLLWLNEEEDFGPFWEPWNTGMFGHKSKDEAKQEAVSWAHAEGVPVNLS